jgi:hypothetical protein
VLDLRLIRERPEEVERGLADKGGAEHVREIRGGPTTGCEPGGVSLRQAVLGVLGKPRDEGLEEMR